MSERLKTLVLLILVVTSIALTGRLLFGQPALETAAQPAYEQLVFGEIRPVSEQTLPTLRLYEEERWFVLLPWDEGHRQAWGLLLDLMRLATVPQPQEEPPQHEEMLISASFQVPSVPGLWLPGATSNDLLLTEVLWSAERPDELWYLSATGEWLRATLPSLPPDWESEAQQAYQAGIVYVESDVLEWEPLQVSTNLLLPEEMPSLAAYSASAEELETDKLLRSLFVDTALVRRIEELDGAFIYTDGQRGLRFFAQGALEYSSPNSEPGQEQLDLPQVLRRTAQYLQLMGGWPEHLYLQMVEESPQLSWDRRQMHTYTLSFYSVQHGLPLITAQPPVSLRLSDRGIIHYSRQITLLDNPASAPQQMTDPLALVETVVQNSDLELSEAILDDVFAAYYLEQSGSQLIAQPVWVFSFSTGTKALVHGHSGRFITWHE